MIIQIRKNVTPKKLNIIIPLQHNTNCIREIKYFTYIYVFVIRFK